MPNERQNPYLAPTPSGVMHAFADASPNEKQQSLQALVSQSHSIPTEEWLDKYSHEWLDEFNEKGWVQRLSQDLPAPNMPLDKFLPYVVASLSGTRKAAIGSNEGFCLARIGYTADEADRLQWQGRTFLTFLYGNVSVGLPSPNKPCRSLMMSPCLCLPPVLCFYGLMVQAMYLS